MKTAMLTSAAALIALVAGFSPARSFTPLALARREAVPRHALVVVDFYTDWCAWCRVLDRAVYPDPQVRRELDRAVFLRLDAEGEGEEAARRYGVDGYPTIVFIDVSGREVGRIRGFLPAPLFAARARAILDGNRP